MSEPYQGKHPLLNRMGKTSDAPAPKPAPMGHPLIRKSPFTERAERGELPAKEIKP